MIVIFALIGVAVILGGFLAGAQVGIMAAFLVKPVIDASWAYSISGINALRLVGFLFPLLVFIYAIKSGKSMLKMPLAGIWLIYVAYSALAFTAVLFESGPMNYAGLVFRVLNGLAGYYMLQTFFSDSEAFRKLLIILILAGLFPVLMGVYQAATGVVWQDQRMTVGLTRNVGLYHDAVSFRYFVFQTFTAVLLYWAYFLPQERKIFLKKIFLLALCVGASIVLYKIYSKAGYLVAALWVIIWSVANRKFMPMILVLSLLLVVNIVYKDKIWSEAQQLFSKEATATSEDATERDKKRAFSGRFYGWEVLIDEFANRSFMEQLVGNGRGGAEHNDFLAKLTSTGYIGLLIYIILMYLIGVRVLRNYYREKSPLNVMAVMLFAMWLVDTIGLTPSLYPSYQWYVWGFIGLSFKGIDWGNAQESGIEVIKKQENDNILARKKLSSLVSGKD